MKVCKSNLLCSFMEIAVVNGHIVKPVTVNNS